MKRISIFIYLLLFLFGSFIHPTSSMSAQTGPVTYSGTITNGAGIPLYNAQISLISSSASYSISTNSDGLFSFLVPADIYTLSLTTTGVSQSVVPSLTNVAVPNISINSDTVQSLTVPTHVLTVTVLDHLGQPVPNIQVAGVQNEIIPAPLYPGGPDVSWGSNINSSGYTNSDGIVDIPLLLSQSVTLYVYPPEGTNLPTIIKSPISFSGTSSTTVNLPVNVTYSGVIVNGDGVPVNNADISLSSPAASNRVRTGLDGSFALQVPVSTYNLILNTNLVSQFIAPSVCCATVQNIAISANTVQNLTIPTQYLTVTVLDANGNPIQNAQVAGVESTTIPSPLFQGGPDVSWGEGVNGSAFTDVNGIARVPLFLSQSVTPYVYPPSGSNLPIFIAQPITFLGAKSIVISYASPTVGAITAPLTPVTINTPVTASASFSEAAFTSPHTASWYWGDGNITIGSVTESNGSGSVSDSHTYTAAGVYTITLTVRDQYIGAGTSTFQYLAVYAPSPSALFSGSRIFNSPVGAYTQNLQLTGKVMFGISVRYSNNNAPTGKTAMNFKAGNLDFVATSYQYLVTSGVKATLKGNGTINGTGNYTFLATGIDDTQPGGQGLIRFQIKDSSNIVIYDTQPGTPDDADPTTPVTGQIIVN